MNTSEFGRLPAEGFVRRSIVLQVFGISKLWSFPVAFRFTMALSVSFIVGTSILRKCGHSIFYALICPPICPQNVWMLSILIGPHWTSITIKLNPPTIFGHWRT